MKGDYKVGFKKPPKKFQYKPGQSGNLPGRPKGTRNLKTDLEEELRTRVSVSEGGKQRRLSKQQVMLKALMNGAMKGNMRSAAILLNLIIRVLDPTGAPTATPVSAADQELVEAFLKRHMKR